MWIKLSEISKRVPPLLM